MKNVLSKMGSISKKGVFGGSMKVGMKISCAVGLCLIALVAVSAVSFWQMNKIGAEIESIAKNDIPLIEAVTKVTVHQLEQAINFERALRSGADMEKYPEAKKEFETAVKHFDELSTKVNKEIVDAEALAKKASEHANTEEELAEFKHVLEAMTKIEHAHKSFEDHVHQVFKLIIANDQKKVHELTPMIEKEEEKLDHELTALLTEIEKFTIAAGNKAEEHKKFAAWLILSIALAGFFTSTLLVFMIVKFGISRPLSEVTTALEALTSGDTSVEITARSDDEIGAVANALNIFKGNMIKMEEMKKEQEETELRNVEEKKKAMNDMADNFESSVKVVVDSVGSSSAEMEATSQTMAATAEETSTQATTVAAASEQATNNVQTAASAAEELSASINEITQQVTQSATIAQKAVEDTRKTNETVQGLAEAAQKIGDVVGLINDIAAQTNLLALNATIEAARAGDAGKGFAVVASEVKSLATQTAQATEEIAGQINAMQGVTEDAVTAIGGISTTIEEINEIASSISAAVEEQGAATQEIARNVGEAASGTQEVSSNITGVTTAAQETGTAAEQMKAAASTLSKDAENLSQEVEKFLAQIRAA